MTQKRKCRPGAEAADHETIAAVPSSVTPAGWARVEVDTDPAGMWSVVSWVRTGRHP